MISKSIYGVEFFFNDEDYHLLHEHKWFLERQLNNGIYLMATYKQVNGKKIRIKIHRLIAEATKIIEGIVYNSDMIVDHANRNTCDNTRENLRLCTKSQNAMNSKARKDNFSGYKGVSWKKDKKKWKAYLSVNGKQIHLGYFDRLEDAVEARVQYAKFIFGEFFADGVEGVYHDK